mmetsp:Transcript_33824/g.97106  ORF Transcript_33824/g.97106 Transcript_33824/m.97106 type:complete len:226 (-) Transcript_33824:185-862(-)
MSGSLPQHSNVPRARQWAPRQLIDVVATTLQAPRVGRTPAHTIHIVRVASGTSLDALDDGLRNGHTHHLACRHCLEGRCIRPHGLQLLPRRQRQPHELRQHPHRAPLRHHAGVHRQPHGKQQEHKGAREREQVEPEEPLRSALLQTALNHQGDREAQLEGVDDQVGVHLPLREFRDVTHVLAPKVSLLQAHLRDGELLLLPHLPVVHKVLAIVAEQRHCPDGRGA